MEATTQRKMALLSANQTRSQHSRIRLVVSARTPTLAESMVRLATVIETDPAAQTMKLSKLLMWSYGISTMKTAAVLRRIHASNMRMVGDLTERQMALLLETLRNG